MIIYDEPWPGLSQDGKDVTCNKQIHVTARDAIMIQRKCYQRHKKLQKLTDDELLDEFMVVHWAKEVT